MIEKITGKDKKRDKLGTFLDVVIGDKQNLSAVTGITLDYCSR